MRLDQALLQRGLVASRSAAARLIQDGAVSVNGERVTKAAFEVSEQSTLTLAPSRETDFVSRAGAKLEGVFLARPALKPAGYWVDFGQSTGGFSDCLLKHGVSRVLGFDVGHDQLHDNLRLDPRVFCVEGHNLRKAWPVVHPFHDEQSLSSLHDEQRQSSLHDEQSLSAAAVDGGPCLHRKTRVRQKPARNTAIRDPLFDDLIADLSGFDRQWPAGGADGVVIDVSFIALSYVIEQAIQCLRMGGHCIALIKPQFELGADPSLRKRWFKHGLLRESPTLQSMLQDLVAPFATLGLHFDVQKDLLASVLPGQSGNQEYFLVSQRQAAATRRGADIAREVPFGIEHAQRRSAP